MALRYLDILIQQMRLSERKHWGRDIRITCAAKMHPQDVLAIDTVAERLGITRNEFVLSSAVSVANAYAQQNEIDLAIDQVKLKHLNTRVPSNT